MAPYMRPVSWIALFSLCLVGLKLTQHGGDAARLAATKAARKEAAAKLDEAKSPEEIKKEKELRESLKADIERLLKDSNEYKKVLIKKKQEQELAEYTPEELEKTDLWRNEYEKFMKAEKGKEFWERVGIVTGISAGVSTGLAGFGKVHENDGGVAKNAAAEKLMKGAGTVALISGAAALLSWLMRRQNKKRQKLYNARLARMQFEARTGLKPSEENVLGPEESDLFKKKEKKNTKQKDDDE